LIFGQLTKRFQETVLGLLKIQLLQNIIHASITFILVAFAWIFFAAHNNADSIYIIKHLFSQNSHSISQIIEIIGENDLYLILISVFILEFVQWQQRGKLIANHFESKPKWQQWMAYYLILLMILCFGVYNNSQFIYFQF
jgi:ABC-type xylose transport system permease subunit